MLDMNLHRYTLGVAKTPATVGKSIHFYKENQLSTLTISTVFPVCRPADTSIYPIQVVLSNM